MCAYLYCDRCLRLLQSHVLLSAEPMADSQSSVQTLALGCRILRDQSMSASSSQSDRQQRFDAAVCGMIENNVPAHHIESLRLAWSQRLDEVASAALNKKIKTEPLDVAAAFGTVADVSTQSQALSVSDSDTVPWDRQPDVLDDATRLHGTVERALFQVAQSRADADQLELDHAALHAQLVVSTPLQNEQARATAALADHRAAAQKLQADNAAFAAAENMLLAEHAAAAALEIQKLKADNAAAAAAEKNLLDEQARSAAAAALEIQRVADHNLHVDNAGAAAAARMLLDEHARSAAATALQIQRAVDQKLVADNAAAAAAEQILLDEHARCAAAAALQVQQAADQKLQVDSAVAALEKKLLYEHAAAAALDVLRAADHKLQVDTAAAAAAHKELLHEQARAAAEKLLSDNAAAAAASKHQEEAMKKLQAERAARDAAQVRLQAEAAMNLKAEKEAFEAMKASYAKQLQDERDSAAAEKLRIQHAADAQHALSLQLAAAKDKLQCDHVALLLAERAESAAAAAAAVAAAAALQDEKMRLDRAAVSENEIAQLEKDRAIMLQQQQQQQQQQQHLHVSKHGIQPEGAAESLLRLPPRPRSRSRSPVGGHRHSGPAGGVVAEWVSSTTHRVLVIYNILHMFVLMLQPLCCCYALITSTTPCMLTPL